MFEHGLMFDVMVYLASAVVFVCESPSAWAWAPCSDTWPRAVRSVRTAPAS